MKVIVEKAKNKQGCYLIKMRKSIFFNYKQFFKDNENTFGVWHRIDDGHFGVISDMDITDDLNQIVESAETNGDVIEKSDLIQLFIKNN